MRFIILTLTAVLCLALVSSHPLPDDGLRSEALDRLVMAEADSEAALRSKRTIGILRNLFPEISQRIESKVNAIIAEVIRALGPVVLRNFLGGGANTPGVVRSNSGTSVEGPSPFGDDEDNEDNDDIGTSSTGSNGSRVSINLPTFPPDDDAETSSSTASSITTATDTIASGNDVDAATATTTTPSPSDNEVTTSL